MPCFVFTQDHAHIVFVSYPFSSPQHDPWPYRPGQPAPRTGLPEERRGSLHSFRQMDKSAEHTQPSDCEQAHMMAHKMKRQIGMFEYIYVCLLCFERIRWSVTLHRFWECHQMSAVLLYWWRGKYKMYFIFVLCSFFPCATYKCSNKSPNVYEDVCAAYSESAFLVVINTYKR